MGVVYDCRKDNREPGSRLFPVRVKIVDPSTGERIPNVFYASTSPARLGRFVTGPSGEPMVDARSRRKVRDGENARGYPKFKIVYDRLEVWADRPWKAVALDTNEVVTKSEGCL